MYMMENSIAYKTYSINLNAQHVNGMTLFDLAVHMYGYKVL